MALHSFFFIRTFFYKNVQAEINQNFKNILRTCSFHHDQFAGQTCKLATNWFELVLDESSIPTGSLSGLNVAIRSSIRTADRPLTKQSMIEQKRRDIFALCRSVFWRN